jgi:hypothetical protein
MSPGLNSIPSTVLKLRQKRVITFLTKAFNEFFLMQNFQPTWKHACMFSIPNPGKNHTLPSSKRSLILLDIAGKFFEKIPLIRVIRKVIKRGFLHDELFISQLRNFPNVLPVSHNHMSWHAGRHGPG